MLFVVDNLLLDNVRSILASELMEPNFLQVDIDREPGAEMPYGKDDSGICRI